MKKNLKLILSIVCILTMIFCLSACGGNEGKDNSSQDKIEESKNQINLNDYVEFTFNGFDGYGTADAEFNLEKMLEENKEKFNYDSGSKSETDTLKSMLYNCISGQLVAGENLSNGDVIEFNWNNYPSDIKEQYGVELKYEDINKTITELTKLQEINLFENVTFTYSGIAPYGKANANWDESLQIKGLSYEINNASGLSNGDKVTITAFVTKEDTPESLKDFFGRQGYKVPKMSAEYTVEGLSSYISKTDELSEDVRNELNTYIVEKKTNEFVGKEVKLDKMELLGIVILNTIEYESYKPNNYIYLVYEMTVSSETFSETYYYYARFSDVTIDLSGKTTIDKSSMTAPSAWSILGMIEGEGFIKHNMLFQGFETYEAFYVAHITNNANNFTHSTDIN